MRVVRALLALLTLAPTWAQLNMKLTVGYLTAVKGTLKDRQGLAVSGAISMAIEDVIILFIIIIFFLYLLKINEDI